MPPPSRLEYAYAFDLMASWLGGFRPPLLAAVTTSEFLDHVLVRAEGEVDVLETATVGGATGRLRASAAGVRYATAVWASPQPCSWKEVWEVLCRRLAPDGRLCVLSGTAAGALLGPARRQRRAGEPAALAGPFDARLAASGWRTLRAADVGGLAGAGWAVCARLAEGIGRPHWADRAERAHHEAVTDGRGASYRIVLAGRSRE